MRAYVYDSKAPGGYSFRTDAPAPSADALSAGHVLVAVLAASTNPVDYKRPSISLFSSSLDGVVVGQDFHGRVLATAPGSAFSPGDLVWGTVSGALCERAVVREAAIARSPAGLPPASAAALVTAALTGLQALDSDRFGGKGATAKPGGSVVVAGAAGGMGSAGVQIARALVGPAGRVVGICSAASAPVVSALGACDAVIAYDDADKALAELSRLGPFDVAYDCVTASGGGRGDTLGGVEYYDALRPFLAKPGGRIVAINGSTAQWLTALVTPWWQPNDLRLFLQSATTPGCLDAAAKLVEEGKLKAVVDQDFPFTAEGVAAAYARLRSRRARGKVVVSIT